MSHSLAEQVALLSEADREEVLKELDPEALLWNWDFWSRPEQQAPRNDEYSILLALAGRGWGKTRASSEWIREKAKITKYGQLRMTLVARTAADVRDVVVEGESGILAVCPPSERPEYQPSKRRLTWPNGNVALCATADEPDGLRGVQSHFALADEFASWRQIGDQVGMTAWENLRISNRLGDNPQIFIATTPKRVPQLRDLIKEAETNSKIVIRTGSTKDNSGNLSNSYIQGVYGTYGNTRLAQQELLGMMLDDIEGALWNMDVIDTFRHRSQTMPAPLIVVGVDPTVAERPGDECGIVVCASTIDRDLYRRQAWVLEDASVMGSPETWARRVVATARKWGAPVVAEVNQGGAMVRNAISQIDPGIPVYEVWAKQGKALRAEPVALAYEQGRVHHLGVWPELETQMTTWEPGARGSKSPDRVDALVHALTALLIKPPKNFGGGPIRAKSMAGRTIPLGKGFSSTRQRPQRGGRVVSPR